MYIYVYIMESKADILHTYNTPADPLCLHELFGKLMASLTPVFN
jgi:hypothetical protein